MLGIYLANPVPHAAIFGAPKATPSAQAFTIIGCSGMHMRLIYSTNQRFQQECIGYLQRQKNFNIGMPSYQCKSTEF
jgi:hypothetical protein